MATITSDDATILRPYYRMKFSEGTTGIHQHANRCSKFQRALVDRHLVAAFTTESQNSEQLFTCAENKPDYLFASPILSRSPVVQNRPISQGKNEANSLS